MIAARMPFCVLILLVLSSASARTLVKHRDAQAAVGDDKSALAMAGRNLLQNDNQTHSIKGATTIDSTKAQVTTTTPLKCTGNGDSCRSDRRCCSNYCKHNKCTSRI
jgi:hypothetical protein